MKILNFVLISLLKFGNLSTTPKVILVKFSGSPNFFFFEKNLFSAKTYDHWLKYMIFGKKFPFLLIFNRFLVILFLKTKNQPKGGFYWVFEVFFIGLVFKVNPGPWSGSRQQLRSWPRSWLWSLWRLRSWSWSLSWSRSFSRSQSW